MSKYSKKKKKTRKVCIRKKLGFSVMFSRNEVFYTFWPFKSLGERIPKKSFYE